jgi:hypothetical protein
MLMILKELFYHILSGTGKTNFFRRLTNQPFIKNSRATIGVEFSYYRYSQ